MEREPGGIAPLVDAHHDTPHDDPNVSPPRYQVVEDFDGLHVAVAVLLGLVASVGGLIMGLLLIND